MATRLLLRNLTALFLISALLCACSSGGGGDSDSASSTASVRLVNLTSAGDLTLTVDDTSRGGAVASGAASAYSSVDAETVGVFASSAGAALSTSATSSTAFAGDTDYSVVAYERGGQIKLLVVTETDTTPSSGFALVTVNNADADAGNLDVYVVAPGADITDRSPTFSISVSSASTSNSVSAGTYDLVVTASSKPADVRLRLPSVQLADAEVINLILTPTTGGALVDGALVRQQGSISLMRNPSARVRVAAALPAGTGQNPVIVARVGGSALGQVTAPSVGSAYGLVPAGATSYDVQIDGVPLASLPPHTFSSGGDYTIVAYGGSAAAADVNVLTDNNRLPANSGVRIRLVNAGVPTAGLSLSANSISLVSEVVFGDASTYSSISAGSNQLVVTSPAISFTTYTSTQSLSASSVYTLFVLNFSDSTTVKYVLTKDR
ncbi:MAG TPA: DUF4397 domain-containing protein [Steroidobacteraceae bacterium]|nr:DUF4397 domain-containing protein [Steroidobacteraceae bacterium]